MLKHIILILIYGDDLEIVSIIIGEKIHCLIDIKDNDPVQSDFMFHHNENEIS
jgi:hypothetical protein